MSEIDLRKMLEKRGVRGRLGLVDLPVAALVEIAESCVKSLSLARETRPHESLELRFQDLSVLVGVHGGEGTVDISLRRVHLGMRGDGYGEHHRSCK